VAELNGKIKIGFFVFCCEMRNDMREMDDVVDDEIMKEDMINFMIFSDLFFSISDLVSSVNGKNGKKMR